MPAEPRITAKVMFTMPATNIMIQCGLENSVRMSSMSRVCWAAGGWIRSRVVKKQTRNSTTAATLNKTTVACAPRLASPPPRAPTSQRKLVLAMIPPICASDMRYELRLVLSSGSSVITPDSAP